MQNVSSGIYGQQRPRSDCAFAQSDQGLHCPLTESLDTTGCMLRDCGISWVYLLLFSLSLFTWAFNNYCWFSLTSWKCSAVSFFILFWMAFHYLKNHCSIEFGRTIFSRPVKYIFLFALCWTVNFSFRKFHNHKKIWYQYVTFAKCEIYVWPISIHFGV